jgi:hypothetical protein
LTTRARWDEGQQVNRCCAEREERVALTLRRKTAQPCRCEHALWLRAIAMQGTCTGEHGVVLSKRASWWMPLPTAR